MTLMEFSMIPWIKGPVSANMCAEFLTLVDQSGLEYRLNPMGTVVEGEWDDSLKLLLTLLKLSFALWNRIPIG